MLLRFVLVTEILSVVVCIHRIFGEKVKFEIKTILLFLGLLTVLEIANTQPVPKIFSLLVYLLIILYCVFRFRRGLLDAIINNVLYLVVMTILQFLCLIPVAVIFPYNEYVRALLVNIAVLLICVFVISRLSFHLFSRWLRKKEKSLYISLGTLCMVAVFILVQAKAFQGLMGYSLFLLIPIILLVIVFIIQWHKYHGISGKPREERNKKEKDDKAYNEFLTQIRMRQHEINNHITAVLSMHYTNKTYEDLVRAQEKYFSRVVEENKYNSLLALEDGVIIGFLYGKLGELEDEVEITYKITVESYETIVSAYYIVQMLGILLDNAAEAIKGIGEAPGKIHLEIRETQEAFTYEVRNPFPYVPYSELEGWFALGKSNKGSERGVGLYHLKYLCGKLGCDLICRNIEMEEENWISFLLKVNKTIQRRED
mgnify:CR=1 FL=1